MPNEPQKPPIVLNDYQMELLEKLTEIYNAELLQGFSDGYPDIIPAPLPPEQYLTLLFAQFCIDHHPDVLC